MEGAEGSRVRGDQEVIFIDANVFLSFIVAPVTPHDVEMQQRSRILFGEVAEGTVVAVTTEVVLHEVCWILGAKRRYSVPAQKIVDYMRTVLSWPGWSIAQDDLRVYYRALEIFERDPSLEYSDSLVVARAEASSATLATFDRRLAKAYSGTVWE